MDDGTDWPRLSRSAPREALMPASAAERLAVSPRTKSQPHTAAAPFLPTASHAAYKLRADEATQPPRQSTSTVPARQPSSSAAEHKSLSSAQQPRASAREYSPASPHSAPRRSGDPRREPMHGAAPEHPARESAAETTARANLERKLSTNLQQPAERHISPEKTTRAYLEPKARSVHHRTKVLPSGSSEGGAQSAPAPTGVAAHARKRTHEPRAQLRATPAGSGAAHRKASPRKGKTSHISCTNNALSPRLRQNGGTLELGTPSQCFKKGFGGGYYQKIEPAKLEEFLADFSAPFKKIVNQPLFYGNGPTPPGKIRATLSQSMQRGFGVGSMQLAKKILKERERAARSA